MKLFSFFMSVISSAQRLVEYAQSLITDNADLKQKLADALANDKASAEFIAAARVEAEAAKAKVTELQTLADADVAEDAELQTIIDAVLPVEEVEVEAAPTA